MVTTKTAVFLASRIRGMSLAILIFVLYKVHASFVKAEIAEYQRDNPFGRH